MQEKRPDANRTLASEIQQEALKILRKKFGEDVEIDFCKVFSSEMRRNVLARIYLKSASGVAPDSVIFKQSLPRPTDGDYTEANARFSRDWAGLAFANK